MWVTPTRLRVYDRCAGIADKRIDESTSGMKPEDMLECVSINVDNAD